MSDLSGTTIFDRLGPNLEDQKRMTLEALARGGTAGVDAFKAAQQGVQSTQQTALDQAMGDSQRAGLGGAAQAEISRQLRQPGDSLVQQLQGAQGTYEADVARSADAMSRYMDEVSAGAATVKAQGDAEVALAKQMWEQDQAMKAAAGRGGGGGGGGGGGSGDVFNPADFSDSELTKWLMGGAEMEQRADVETAQRSMDQARHDERAAQSHASGALDFEIAASEQAAFNDTGPFREPVTSRSSSESGRRGIGGSFTRPPQPRPAQTNYEEVIDQQAVRQEQARRAQAERQQEIEQLRNQPLFQIAREIGSAWGLDPYRTTGLISPGSGTLASADDYERQMAMEMADRAREGAFFNETGFESPQEMQGWLGASDQLGVSPVDQALARQAGVDAPVVMELRGTPEYQAVRQAADAVVQASLRRELDMPLTEDQLRSYLFTQAPSVPPQVRELVIAEVRQQLQSSSFFGEDVDSIERELAGGLGG
ncbi:MAG: hypothetical protein AB7G37_03425 [Solirubrobacteraceae bacterium]